jgi:hypothetical protein
MAIEFVWCKNTHFSKIGRGLFLENTNRHELATKSKIRRSQFSKIISEQLTPLNLRFRESFMDIRVEKLFKHELP